jgi:hypothetical protein
MFHVTLCSENRNCVVGGSRAAKFVTFDNCRRRKVRRELIIGCLSNTLLPFLVGLFVCLRAQIDASLHDTETRRLGYQCYQQSFGPGNNIFHDIMYTKRLRQPIFRLSSFPHLHF